MPSSLAQRVRDVQRIARRLAFSRACFVVAASVLLGILIAGGVDYSLRLTDVGTRVLLSVFVLGLAMVMAWHWLVPVLRMHWSDRVVASMIERRFPELSDRLSSALAFEQLPDEDLRSGSSALKKSVIIETAGAVEQLQLQDAIDYGPWRQALGCFALATSLGAVAFASNSAGSWQALRRLARPWSDDPWPRQFHLKFVEKPHRVARGSDLRFQIQERDGELPPQVLMHLWHLDRPEREAETVAMHRVGDAMVLQRNNLTQSLRYRATGGDDDRMEWVELQVVEPPTVIEGGILLTPPSYTGWPATSMSVAHGGLRVLEGTRIEMQATTDRELQTAAVQLTSPAGDQVVIPALVRDQAKTFTIPDPDDVAWVATTSGEYALFLQDSKGTETVTNARWQLRVLADQPPVIRPITPEAEEFVTPEARLQIRSHVEDDLAAHRVELRYTRTDQSDFGDVTITIWEGPEAVQASTPETLPPTTDAREISFDWDLRPLSLATGAVVSYQLRAEDYKPQASQTMARRLQIVTPDELVGRVSRRQSQVLSELRKRLTQQRLAQTQIEAVRTRLQEDPRIEKATMDRLRAGLLSQRQVNAALHGAEANIIMELQRLADMLDRSLLEDVDVRRKVERTRNVLVSLGPLHLEPALRDGSSAQQALQATRDQDRLNEVPAEVPALLSQTAGHQQAVVAAIETLIDDMSVWDNYRRLAEEVHDVLDQQREATAETQQLARETLSRSKAELQAKQRAQLRHAAGNQAELARRMDRSLRNLARAAAELEQGDGASAAMVRDALASARDGAVSGKMRQASQQIDENRLGLAAQQQAAAEDILRRMLSELSTTTVASPRERARQLVVADRELQTLQREQAELTHSFGQAQERPNPGDAKLQGLVDRQQQLTQEMAKLERGLRRLRASSAARQMVNAGASSQQAARAADEGQAEKARKQSRATEEQLAAARTSLQQSQAGAEQDIAQEQVAGLRQQIAVLVSRQETVVGEVDRLHGLPAEVSLSTEVQRMSLGMVAVDQRAVSQETDAVASQLDKLPSFAFALDTASETMDQAAEVLDQRQLTATSRQLVQAALEELRRVRVALEQVDDEKPNSPPQQSSATQQAGETANQAELLVQLKMLREMQYGINQQTQALDFSAPSSEQQREARAARIQELARRQRQLSKLVNDFIGPDVLPPEADDAVPRPAEPIPTLDGLDRELELLLP